MIENKTAREEIKRQMLTTCLNALLEDCGDGMLLDVLSEVFAKRLKTDHPDNSAALLRAAGAAAREANINEMLHQPGT
jgi:hypothetical protein